MKPPVPVIDIHVHIQPMSHFKPHMRPLVDPGPELLPALENPAELLRRMDAAGIERIGLIQYVAPEVMGFGPEVIDYGLKIASHAPERFLPFGSVHPKHEPDPGGAVARLHDRGVRALKFHPPHQLFAPHAYLGEWPTLAAAYQTAQERRMPVMFHTGTSIFQGARNRYADPMPADDVAVDFPDLPIILAHAGRPLYMDTAFFLARRHPNVYLDISGIPPKKLLQYLPRLPQIADKVLWGTDWPSPGVTDMGKNIHQFLELGLDPEVERKVLRENALRVFGLAP